MSMQSVKNTSRKRARINIVTGARRQKCDTTAGARTNGCHVLWARAVGGAVQVHRGEGTLWDGRGWLWDERRYKLTLGGGWGCGALLGLLVPRNIPPNHGTDNPTKRASTAPTPWSPSTTITANYYCEFDVQNVEGRGSKFWNAWEKCGEGLAECLPDLAGAGRGRRDQGAAEGETAVVAPGLVLSPTAQLEVWDSVPVLQLGTPRTPRDAENARERSRPKNAKDAENPKGETTPENAKTGARDDAEESDDGGS